jgi:DMSO/TMAO reductase YedYZ molybdopterin-dependent catalytic subunit
MNGSALVAGVISGIVSAALALGIGQLLAGPTAPQAAPVTAVGQAAIGLTPGPVEHWATRTFGTSDKDVLLTGVVVVLLLFSAALGAAAVRRLSLGMWGLTVLAAVGIAAAVTRHNASWGYALPTLIGALAAAFALSRLTRLARRTAPAAPAGPAIRASSAIPAGLSAETGGTDELRAPGLPGGSGPDAPGEDDPDSWSRVPDPRDQPRPAGEQPGSGRPATEWVVPEQPVAGQPVTERAALAEPGSRRSFLVASGVTLAVAAVGGVAGRNLSERSSVSAASANIRFPKAAVAAPPLPKGINPPVPGLSSFITPNGSFYRVDTALTLPQVDPSSWQLRIHGMVKRELTITLDDLLRQPLIEDYITLCCVSNPVSGDYIGNAKWLGASLASLLRKAGIQPGADQLLCTSVDGYTSGTPAQVIMDDRDALLAVAMNGTALPVEHGFPARMVTPGLYGYVSATKWITDIQVTTFAQARGYWANEGWSQQGPIKTESRIDVPSGTGTVKAGRTPVAGVAWAQHKGIEAVEVRVDSGPWNEATLAAVPNLDTWRQWTWDWDATPGNHIIEARATDKTGYTQTSLQAPPAPNGASGYPMNQVTVSA